jgi:glycosyltransferase involved in cell wall biosynthesis
MNVPPIAQPGAATGSVIFINPMQSSHPTGLGLGGNSLLECFPECRDEFSDKIYRFINDRIKWSFGRMVLRQLTAEFCVWRHRRRVLIFCTHQGPLIRHQRCVVIVHDFIALHHPFQSRLQVAGFLFLLPRIVRNASAVVVISNHVREDLLRHFPEMKKKTIRVIPSISTRLDTFKPGGQDWNARLKEGRFLFVGAKFLHKRLDAAIETVLELRRKGWKVGLDIVGVAKPIWENAFGFNFDVLKDQGIVVKSYISDTELEALYSKAIALFYPSESEGLGVPPLEAMRKDCPVICNDTAEMRDTCAEAAFFVDVGRQGAMVEIVDRMLSGSLMPEVNRKIVLGRERSTQFFRDKIVPRWLAFFGEFERLFPSQL